MAPLNLSPAIIAFCLWVNAQRALRIAASRPGSLCRNLAPWLMSPVEWKEGICHMMVTLTAVASLLWLRIPGDASTSRII